MTILTIIFILFTLVLYLFLIMVKRDIKMAAVKRRWGRIVIPVISIAIAALSWFGETTVDAQIRGICSGLIFLTLLLDSRGLAEDHLVTNPFDIRGIAYDEINRVVLYQENTKGVIKMNYFRHELRGPLLKFDQPLEELVVFLSEHLKEGTPIDILFDKDES